MLDPVKLETLRAVTQHRSFSAAAAALNLTQPAVSRQIAALERQVGTHLVRRLRGRVDATPAGELLLRHAAVALDRLALAEAQVRSLVAAHGNAVRLGSFFSALVHLSAEAGAILGDTHPGLRIADDLVDRAEAYAKVSRGDIDLALVFTHRFTSTPPPDGVRVRRLFDDPLRVLLPAGHPAAGRAAVDLADLCDDVWIRAHDGALARLLDLALADRGLHPPLLLAGHGEEPVEVQALVAAGRGITLSYDLTVVVSEHDLRLIPLVGPAAGRTVSVAVPDGPLTPPVRATLDALIEVGRRRGAALRP